MAEGTDVPDDVLHRLRAICTALPEVHEEQAWVGTRWRIRTATFAHVLVVADGKPASHARAAGIEGRAVVLTFRAAGLELEALRQGAPRSFAVRWGRDVAGLVLDDRVDWQEVGELLTDSYCLLAPKRLAATVLRPPPA